MISEGGPGPFLVQALYSFKGQNNDELEFKKGDIITVCQAEEGGWWEGTLDGDTGWFPSNYVNKYTPPENSRINGDSAGGRQVMNQQQVYRNQILKELLESEEAHVEQLRSLQTFVLKKLETSSLLLDNEFSQLVGNFDELVKLHEELLETLKTVREKSLVDQRIGKLFLDFAPIVKEKLLLYCSNHPRAVLVLEKYKSELNAYVEGVKEGSGPGILYLTTGLSRPFRRLEKYAGMLQELSRHLDDGHPDRGDTLRVATVYTEIAGACSNMRRQKELELEVLTGRVDGWRDGANLSSLGSILKMGQVNVLSEDLQPHDRYLVLFPHTLILLSVTKCSSAFIFEGKMEMPGLSIREVEDAETNKNCFDISKGEDHWLINCHSRDDCSSWLNELQQENAKPASPSPQKKVFPPALPPHRSLTGNGNSIESASKSSLVYGVAGGAPSRGSVLCLRPSPPTRVFCSSQDVVSKKKFKKSDWKPDDKSFEDDALILKVVEAYCTSAKSRNTLNPGVEYPQVLIAEEEKIIVEETVGDGVVLQEKSLVDTVYALRDDLSDLREDVSHLKVELEEERASRKQLEMMLAAMHEE